jgi:acyl-coenzyme A thioesterase PaaI-like protein
VSDVGPGLGFPGVDGPSESTSESPHNRLAGAMRRISAVVVGQPLTDEQIDEAAERIAVVADELEAAAEPVKRTRAQPDPISHPQDHFSTSPMVGYANPIAPPVTVWVVHGEDGQREIRGTVTFGYQYEGPPTCVHGGVIAELFDELLGLSNIAVGEGAMTGTLKIRYNRPTPLLAPLQLVARNTGRDGRKVFAWGGIYYEGELTAEAEGIFIDVMQGKMLEIVRANADVAEARLVDPQWERLIERDAEQRVD